MFERRCCNESHRRDITDQSGTEIGYRRDNGDDYQVLANNRLGSTRRAKRDSSESSAFGNFISKLADLGKFRGDSEGGEKWTNAPSTSTRVQGKKKTKELLFYRVQYTSTFRFSTAIFATSFFFYFFLYTLFFYRCSFAFDFSLRISEDEYFFFGGKNDNNSVTDFELFFVFAQQNLSRSNLHKLQRRFICCVYVIGFYLFDAEK